MRLLKIDVVKVSQWVGIPRWRVTAITNMGRTVTFIMYSEHEPTLPEAEKHFNENSGEALDVTPLVAGLDVTPL